MLDDHRVRTFVAACLEALGKLTPRRTRVATAAGSAFTTTHGVVDRVHRDTSVVWTTTEPARAPSFAELQVLVVTVGDLTHRSPTLDVDLADFTARQLDLRVVTVLRHQLRCNAR